MRVARTIFTVAAIALFALISQEYAIRLTLPEFDPSKMLRFLPAEEPLPILGPKGKTRRLVKNSGDYNVSVTFNKHGLRDDKNLNDAAADDILLVGDSFGFGWGVEENERVSEILEKKTGRLIFNVATPGDLLSYQKQLNYARSLGAKASNLIIMFNMTNDINNYNPSSRSGVEQKRTKKKLQISILPIKEFLLENSALYFLLTSLTNQNNWIKRLGENIGVIIPLSRISNPTKTTADMLATLKQLHKLSEGYNAIIVLIPNRGIWIGNKKLEVKNIHDKFVEMLRASGLAFIDMRVVQEADDNPMSFHFTHDGHWRPSGHLAAANILSKTAIFDNSN